MSRISTHKIETRAKDIIRKRINEYDNSSTFLFREITERDYGIDAVVEKFEDDNPTGKIMLLQIKGKEASISPLRNGLEVSCRISLSNYQYSFQSNIPVVVAFVSINNPESIYYLELNRYEIEEEKLCNQNKFTIHIPAENVIVEDCSPLVVIIDKYYDNQE